MSVTKKISIWDAKNNLLYDEPVEEKDVFFVETEKARGDFRLTHLYRDLNVDSDGKAHKPPRKQYILFTGHRGCGKSTELLRVSRYLHNPERYWVVHLDCLKKLDVNNLKYSDVLLALASTLLENLEREENITLDSVHFKRLEAWYQEKIESHTEIKELAAEIKAGADVKTGLPFLVNLFVQLTNKINIGSTYREELRRVVRNSYTEFAESFNTLIRAAEDKLAEQGLGKRILFAVDGTDRLDREDATEFFIENVHQLKLIRSIFIYCAPIHLLHSENQLSANFGQPFRVPMLKIKDKNENKIDEHFEVMRELVKKRVPEYFFDDDATLNYLVGYSGGHPRDMLRLLNVAINQAEGEMIDKESARKAVRQVANEYRRILNSQDYEILIQIDNNPDTPDDYTDEETTRMLYNLVLLEYNDYFWKSHPLIRTLPGYQKAAAKDNDNE